jgi:hypothetical protein
MPAVITHYTFAKEITGGDGEHIDAFYLGAQGPDPFFFYGQVPWKPRKGKNEVDQFGRDLHHLDIAPVYDKLIKYAIASEDKDMLLRYIHGLFAHYSLDRRAHPYIFVKAGFAFTNPSQKLFSSAHCRFEAIIDLLLGKQDGTFARCPARYLKVSNHDLLSISKMWDAINKLTLQKKDFGPKSFYYGVKDYMTSLRMTNLPYVWSGIFLHLVLGGKSLPTQMHYFFHLPKIYRDLDFLNVKKEAWPNFVNNEPRHESFQELWDDAKEDCRSLSPILEKEEKGEDALPELEKFVDKINHDGFKTGEQMKYMDPIWPEYRQEIAKKAKLS